MPGIYRTGGAGGLGVLVEVVVDVLLGRAVGLVLGVVAAELDAVLRREGALEAPREGAGHAAAEEREVADRAAQGPAAEVVGAEHDAVAEAPRPGEGRVLELARAVCDAVEHAIVAVLRLDAPAKIVGVVPEVPDLALLQNL